MLSLFGVLFLSCKAEPLEGDEEAPVINIISPDINAAFFTSSSSLSPNTAQIIVRATDNNAVTFGIMTIEDPNGDLADADIETSLSENDTVMELTASFTTDTPGAYTLNFLFRDANNNDASISRNIEFFGGGDTDAAK